MSKIIEIALFTSYGIGFYPDKLQLFAKNATEVKMRAEIFPDYIKRHASINGSRSDLQERYEQLEVGEGL